ncbi:MAG: two-component regulator propeller domain-containing protein, partial [Bacteroidales bacterium]
FLCQDIAYITALAADQSGNILIGTHNGLFAYNNKNNSFKHILIDEQSCSSELNNITAITRDNSGSFWIGTNNGFILRHKDGSDSFEKYKSYQEGLERNGIITRLFADKNNNLWVGDINGLSLFDIETGSWNREFQVNSGTDFRKLQITGIDQDPDGQIWISTDGKGIFVINPSGFSHYNISNLPYVSGTLSSNGITSLFCDKSGIVWIGTSKKGVDFYKKGIRKFRIFRNYPKDDNSLIYNDVDCMAEDSKGNLWIGTNGGGLNYYDRKANKFTGFVSKPGSKNSLSSNIIVSLFEDSEKKIWIGTYLGGLNCYDPSTGEFTVYRYSGSDSTSISDDRIWSICEDSNRNIWIATLTNGLNRFDRNTGKFERYNTQNSPICFNYLNSISVDKNDNLWISSANGLIFFNPSQNRANCFFNNPETSNSLSDNQVISTFTDSRGMFWVCTNNGLNLMDRVNGTFRVFREADGLPSSSVLRILEDINSDLWISTKNGISKLEVIRSDEGNPLSFRFINYGISDGLQGKEFTETAAFATRDGEIWFGGPEGLNAFYPEEITSDKTPSELIFTDLRIFNKKINYGETVNNRVLLEKPVFNTDKITLKYKENSFTIDFVVLNYFYPEKNRYLYHLQGFNDKWISTEGNENFATFSNLNNGTYTLMVKAANPDGIWNDKPLEIIIKVLPPLWKSTFAYCLYTILILSMLALLRYLILYRERLNIKIEQEQIESQHLHELDSLKIRFFTNISHEFRTPITLILSPVEKLLNRWKGAPEEKHLKLIQQNAKRLLLMVNQLLDFRRMEVQGFNYNPSYGNIISFICDVTESFTDLSEQKQIKLAFRTDLPEVNTWFDRNKLEKIIFNLLSNAFKFTPSGGSITVSVSVLNEEVLINSNGNNNVSKVRITVEDTGIGIPADKIDKLFSYFYQVNSPFDDQGTGLGLALVKEFVNLHNGEVKVESRPGKGSCFTVSLPLRVDASFNFVLHVTRDSEMQVQSVVTEQESRGHDNGRKYKILVAEDNDDLRFYIKDNLHHHYDIFEASNGEEALGIVLKEVPDLIISDILMPVMDGKELCRKVKTDKKLNHIPFIFITARAGEKDLLECLDLGADDFIPKPFSFPVLEAKITNFLCLTKNMRHSHLKNALVEPNKIDILSLDEQFLQKALGLVEKNISRVDYTVEELSSDLGISRTLFYKKILAMTGKPPLEFIRILRLKRAAQLLLKSQLNVSEVAFKVGYNDPKYFRKHFKNEFGVLPSRYVEKQNRDHDKNQLTPQT